MEPISYRELSVFELIERNGGATLIEQWAVEFVRQAVPLLRDYAHACRTLRAPDGDFLVGAPDTADRIDKLVGSFPLNFPQETTS